MQKIPKIIHYCWFGGKPYSEIMQRCLISWKKFCPDYTLQEWNENNFDVSVIPYVRQAYEAKKWAFVSDYVRLYALYNYGGIYMDTDVELLRPLDNLLDEDGFSGFETTQDVQTALMASRKGHPFIETLLKSYSSRTFVNNDGSMDLTTNVETITNAALACGLKPNGTKQTICSFTFYPCEYFCPIDFKTGRRHITNNTYAIHHFSGTWLTDEQRSKHEKQKLYRRLFGERLSYLIIILQDNLHNKGIIQTSKMIIQKICGKTINFTQNALYELIIRIFPVKKNVLFFESEGDFTDNARSLYDYLLTNYDQKNYKYIWKVSNASIYKKKYGRPGTVFVEKNGLINSLRLAYYVAVSEIFFFTHPFWLKKWKPKQTVVNLWHGCGYKKAKGTTDIGKIFDYTLVTGPLYVPIHAREFNCDPAKILTLGFPRNDCFFQEADYEAYAKLDIPLNATCILWMPTFRKSKNEDISDNTINTTTGLPILKSQKDIQKINQFLLNYNTYLIIKIHHLQDEHAIAHFVLDHIRLITDDFLMEKDIQVYHLLPFTTALITDYSSIAIDYLLLDKPIGFTLDDYDDFSISRGYVFDNPLDYMPGHHIYTFDDLILFLKDVKSGVDPYKNKRSKMLSECYSFADGNSAKRVTERFLERN